MKQTRRALAGIDLSFFDVARFESKQLFRKPFELGSIGWVGCFL
jgi:hypothetical protein